MNFDANFNDDANDGLCDCALMLSLLVIFNGQI